MRVDDLLETFKARMPEEYAQKAVQALREDFGGSFEHIPVPDSQAIHDRLARNAKIISLRATGESISDLSIRFGIAQRTVRHVLASATPAN